MKKKKDLVYEVQERYIAVLQAMCRDRAEEIDHLNIQLAEVNSMLDAEQDKTT